MSQHADLLKFEIENGVRRGHSANAILNDTAELLSVLEYDDTMTSDDTVAVHLHQTANVMRMQKDGLYGLTHAQLDEFIADIWKLIPTL